jgi:hypothetical protein
MYGIVTFPSREKAILEGYEVEQESEDGFIVRRRNPTGQWERARVVSRKPRASKT